jgi:hypothetical protein
MKLLRKRILKTTEIFQNMYGSLMGSGGNEGGK